MKFGELVLCPVGHLLRRRFAQSQVTGNRVKQLVVPGRSEDVVELKPQVSQLALSRVRLVLQGKPLRYPLLHVIDVEQQGVGVGPYAIEPLFLGGARPLFQDRQLLQERSVRFVDPVAAHRNLFRIGGGGQRSGIRHQRAAELRDVEGGGQVRDAPLVDPVLGVAHPVEGIPSHQRCREGQANRATKREVQLGRNAIPEFEEFGQCSHHLSSLPKTSFGRTSSGMYCPSSPIMVRKTSSDHWLPSSWL